MTTALHSKTRKIRVFLQKDGSYKALHSERDISQLITKRSGKCSLLNICISFNLPVSLPSANSIEKIVNGSKMEAAVSSVKKRTKDSFVAAE